MTEIKSHSLAAAYLFDVSREVHKELPAEVRAEIAQTQQHPHHFHHVHHAHHLHHRHHGSAMLSNQSEELMSHHIKKVLFAHKGENPTLAEGKVKLQMTLAKMASDKDSFHAFYKNVYGDRYDANVVEKMRQQFLAGDFSSLPNFRVVSSSSLGGNHAAYADGMVYLNEELLKDPDQLLANMIEETAHHFDTFFGPGDAKGDEGEMFRCMATGVQLSPEEQNRIRNEDDHGTIEVDGKKIQVEFNVFKKIKHALHKVGHALGHFVHSIVKAITDFVKFVVNLIKFVVQMMVFVVDYAVNGEEAVERLKKAFMEMLVSFLQSKLAQFVVQVLVTIFTGGTMTAQTIALMEALKQGVMAAAKQMLIEYIKQEVVNMVVQKIAEASGSETLAAIVGAYLSNPGSFEGITQALTQKLENVTTEQVIDMIKEEVKKQLTNLIVKQINEHVDFAPLQALLSNWVENGANFSSLNEAVDDIQKKMSNTISNMSMDKMLHTAKDMAKGYVADKVADRLGYSPAKDIVYAWSKQGATLDRLPELVGKMQDSAKKELTSKIVEKIADEVGPSPIREALTSWVKAGADFATLPAVMGTLKENFSKEMSSITIDDIVNRAVHEGEIQLISKIQSDVHYKPLQSSLTEWVKHGANLDNFDKVMDSVKSDIENRIDNVQDKAFEAQEKAAQLLKNLFVDNVQQKDAEPIRNLLVAIHDAERNAGASMDISQIVASIKTTTEEQFIKHINGEMSAQLPDGAMKDALMQWAGNGLQTQNLSTLSADFLKNAAANESVALDQAIFDKMLKTFGNDIMHEIFSSAKLGSVENAIHEWPEVSDKLAKTLQKADSVADRMHAGKSMHEGLDTLRNSVLPEMNNAYLQLDVYLKSFQKMVDQTESKMERMKAFQARGGAA